MGSAVGVMSSEDEDDLSLLRMMHTESIMIVNTAALIIRAAQTTVITTMDRDIVLPSDNTDVAEVVDTVSGEAADSIIK